jgi:hypothetical protein
MGLRNLCAPRHAPNRFRDNGCPRYSLRALWRYAPWIDKIHLVTAGYTLQCCLVPVERSCPIDLNLLTLRVPRSFRALDPGTANAIQSARRPRESEIEHEDAHRRSGRAAQESQGRGRGPTGSGTCRWMGHVDDDYRQRYGVRRPGPTVAAAAELDVAAAPDGGLHVIQTIPIPRHGDIGTIRTEARLASLEGPSVHPPKEVPCLR